MRSPRVPLILLLTFVLAGIVAACGASGGEAADTTTTTDRATTTTEDGPPTTSSRRTSTTRSKPSPTDGTTPTGRQRSTDADAYVKALAAKVKDDGSEVFGQAEASCLAGAYLDAIGVEALQAAGISPSDFAESDGDTFDGKVTLTEAMGNQVFDRFEPCGIDLPTLFRQISEVENPTSDQEACFDRILTATNLRRSFVADYTGQELDPDPIDELLTCAS
jgi:hypothetical protein